MNLEKRIVRLEATRQFTRTSHDLSRLTDAELITAKRLAEKAEHGERLTDEEQGQAAALMRKLEREVGA